jgi:predicted MFS family arabinose efflux permease
MDQQGPQEANVPRASGSDLTSLRRPLIVLAIGTFAIGTDAFVIGGVLPAVARSLGVSTSSAGLLVTAFAVAYAISGPVLAVGTPRLPRITRHIRVMSLTV